MPRIRLACAAVRAGSGSLLRQAPLLAALWLAGLAALGLFARSFWPIHPLGGLTGFAPAVAAIDANRRPGSFVVVWPPAQASALDLLPRSWQAADAVPQEAAEHRRYVEIVVLSPAGAAMPPELAHTARLSHRLFDEVAVTTFRYAASARLLFDLRSELAHAAVWLEDASGRRACTQPEPSGGYACPGEPEWSKVTPTTITVEGRPWPGVWAHPRGDKTLVIALDHLSLGSALELEAALADEAVSGSGAPVTLRLAIGGEEERTLVRSEAPGVARLVVATLSGTQADARLAITTPNDSRRHLAVNLRLLEANP
jgi:hypothetical protein